MFEKLLSNHNYYVKYMAVSNIVKIVKANPRLVEERFSESKELLKNSEGYVKHIVANSIAKIIKAMPVQKESTTLQEIAKIRNHYAKPVVASSIAEVVKANPNITQNVFIGLKNLLSDSDEVISCAAAHWDS
ncbi:hypothetical protein [Rickettsia hoogstraalii]|uniref:hypothetical protein n=1 Tax=Rickettsia hoogstraalii TaxID=467174 RepID=UPI00058AF5D9|nr:hypothetical protein [Rickettsia hoogstraalii]